jgi:hypothetical protein
MPSFAPLLWVLLSAALLLRPGHAQPQATNRYGESANARSLAEDGSEFGWFSEVQNPNQLVEEVELTVKVDTGILTIGYELMAGNYVGDEIALQTFSLQFRRDVAIALGIDFGRILFLSVDAGRVHNVWRAKAALVQFKIISPLAVEDGASALGHNISVVDALRDLEDKVKTSEETLYSGRITRHLDPDWGVVTNYWDATLHLTFSIVMVGELYSDSRNQFIDHFEEDIALATGVAQKRVHVLFIWPNHRDVAHHDSISVKFRIESPNVIPSEEPPSNATEVPVAVVDAINSLILQVPDLASTLYEGNVTIRTNSNFGLSGVNRRLRNRIPLGYEFRPTPSSAYERCKDTHRCNRANADYDILGNTFHFTEEAYKNGKRHEIPLFSDFENWRSGSFGWRTRAHSPRQTNAEDTKEDDLGIFKRHKGSHFDTYDFPIIGDFILNAKHLEERIDLQTDYINRLETLVEDLEREIITSRDFASTISRADHRAGKKGTLYETKEELAEAQLELARLEASECKLVVCNVVINTTDATIYGALNFQGVHALVHQVDDAYKYVVPQSTRFVPASFRAVDAAGGQVPDPPPCALDCDMFDLVTRGDVDDCAVTSAWFGDFCLEDCHPDDLRILEEINDIFCDASYGSYVEDEGEGDVEGKREGDVKHNPRYIANGTYDAYDGTGTSVALFNFESIDLGPMVNLTILGDRPMVLLSRSSIYFNTTMITSREEKEKRFGKLLGGFPGGNNLWENNRNGPGSGNVRVYLLTVSTHAEHVKEVQTVTTSAQSGQTLSGGFYLHFKGDTTHLIPHDASPEAMKFRIESSLREAGKVEVTCSLPDSQKGRTWTITFLTAIGDVPLLEVTTELFGLKASVVSNTVVDATQLGGNFTVSMFGETTRELPFDVTSAAMELAIMEDMPSILTAKVVRTNPYTDTESEQLPGPSEQEHVTTKQDHGRNDYYSDHVSEDHAGIPQDYCDHGLCIDGPGPSGDLVWALTLTTHVDNVRPMSPTSPEWDEVGPISSMTASFPNLAGLNADVQITEGHEKSTTSLLQEFGFPHVVSMAYGGAGGGFGGNGGKGHGNNVVGEVYGNKLQTDLFGGSGGAVGGHQPYEIDFKRVKKLVANREVTTPRLVCRSPNGTPGGGKRCYQQKTNGRGGHGAGAIELSAVNDITLGSHSVIRMDGDYGRKAHEGGGGGSGGAIVISAGGFIENHGILSANGGSGGDAKGSKSSGGGGGGGGRITIHSHTFSGDRGTIETMAGDGGSCEDTPEDGLCSPGVSGGRGTIHISTEVGFEATVDTNSGGAMETLRALLVRSSPYLETPSSVVIESPYTWNGLDHAILPPRSRPGKLSFFCKLGTSELRTSFRNWGAHFFVFDTTYDSEDDDEETMIGVSLMDAFRHGSNFKKNPETLYYGDSEEFHPYVLVDQWYKIDIFVDWGSKTYNVHLDDTLMVYRHPFRGESIERVGIYNYHAGDTWFDEIFVGENRMMEFHCPFTKRAGVEMDRPVQKGWEKWDLGPSSSNHDKVRHSSHLSTRKFYRHKDGQLIPNDGPRHTEFHSDVITKNREGDHANVKGGFDTGSLLHVRGTSTPDVRLHAARTQAVPSELWSTGETANDYVRQGKDGLLQDNVDATEDFGESGRYYWYGEHDFHDGTDYFKGAVTACSTNDFVTWRNEGIMVHYANFTDMVQGREGPFIAARPKVVYNKATGKYVMWKNVDVHDRSIGLSGVSISDYPNGPFEFVRSFYPDGNETHDQTIFVSGDETENKAFLLRTFYSNVEHVLPKPIMQPLWESVKIDQTVDSGVNYGLNFHRAMYAPDYDDFHDIYLQRWRNEDRPWSVVCLAPGFYEQLLPFLQDLDIDTPDTMNFYRKTWEDVYTPFKIEGMVKGGQEWDGSPRTASPWPGGVKWEYSVLRSPKEMTYIDGRTYMKPDTLLYGRTVHRSDYVREGYNEGLTCDVAEKKIILGQGQGFAKSDPNELSKAPDQSRTASALEKLDSSGPVISRFKDPADPANNQWSPDSVPAVKSQPWGFNYIDGTCGRRNLTEGLVRLDKEIVNRENPDRAECSNIVDNPTHQTIPDQMIGEEVVVETRRAKYVSVSALTNDFLDTSGAIKVYEGELDDELDLISLLNDYGQFDFDAVKDEASIGSTYLPQHFSEFKMAQDWNDRYWQYHDNYNDRAWDSPSCVNDGECPVDFREGIGMGSANGA